MTQPPPPHGRTVAMELKVIRRAVARIIAKPDGEEKDLALLQVRHLADDATQDVAHRRNGE